MLPQVTGEKASDLGLDFGLWSLVFVLCALDTTDFSRVESQLQPTLRSSVHGPDSTRLRSMVSLRAGPPGPQFLFQNYGICVMQPVNDS